MASASLEDRVNKTKVQASGSSKLEKTVQDENQHSSIKEITWDIAKYSPFAAAQFLIFGPAMTLSTLIPMTGLAIGSYFDNKKKKQPTTWRKVRKELYTGNILGFPEYAIYSLPDLLIKSAPHIFATGSLGSMVATTLMFNPLMVFPYIALYQTFTYFRDNVGLKKTLTGLVNGKLFKYLKECKKNKLDKDLMPDSKNTSMYLWPLHFIQCNFHSNPTTRMLQSLFINNPIFRYIMGRGDREKVLGKQETKPLLERVKNYFDDLNKGLTNYVSNTKKSVANVAKPLKPAYALKKAS